MTGRADADGDLNPFLARPDAEAVDPRAGRGRIEVPGSFANIPWQTRERRPTDYENRLGDALETCFSEGITELAALVSRLNALGVPDPDDAPWTEASFMEAMQALG
ncbi:MAG: hypothetical protein GWO22_26310, partial [Actinobacteria bacterium]|nr:hypothetical protein [Actinomycetota bacterium]